MVDESVANFLFEAGMLKNLPRSGWKTIRAPDESVAEHCFRAMMVADLLSLMAKMNEGERLALLRAVLYHDLHEARIGDLHKIARKYAESDEKKAERDQREKLPAKIQEEITNALEGLPKKIIDYASDADKLECAITAKEYLDLGYKSQEWMSSTKAGLRTKEAKELFLQIEKANSLEWVVGHMKGCRKEVDGKKQQES
ncbi:MAG: HD domain-containing protein [Candidatus Micrarchaeia archaeon]